MTFIIAFTKGIIAYYTRFVKKYYQIFKANFKKFFVFKLFLENRVPSTPASSLLTFSEILYII